MPPNTRKVSDLASQYNTTSNSDRDRSWASPASQSQTLPNSRDNNYPRDRLPPVSSTNEFGSIRNVSAPIPRSPRSNNGYTYGNGFEEEKPHSSVCGCARCSAIKYASNSSSPNGPTTGRISPNPNNLNSTPRLRPPPPNSIDSYSYNNYNQTSSGFSNNSSQSYNNGYNRSNVQDGYSNRERDLQMPPSSNNNRSREPNVRRQSLPPPKALEPPNPSEKEYGSYVRGYGGDKVGERLTNDGSYGRRSFERN